MTLQYIYYNIPYRQFDIGSHTSLASLLCSNLYRQDIYIHTYCTHCRQWRFFTTIFLYFYFRIHIYLYVYFYVHLVSMQSVFQVSITDRRVQILERFLHGFEVFRKPQIHLGNSISTEQPLYGVKWVLIKTVFCYVKVLLCLCPPKNP